MNKTSITVFFLLLGVCTIAQMTTLKPGDAAPGIKLLSVSGTMVSFEDYPSAKGFIVVFIGDGCPYSKAYEERIIGLNEKYAPLGFPVIAINPNDSACSPEDAFLEMKKHATSFHYTFPYLFDKEQTAAVAYGPRSTPYVFVINKTSAGNIIVYTGAIDNDTRNNDPSKHRYVEDAITALLNHQQPEVSTTRSIGCSICWRKTNNAK
jgi:thiol-disulfide isomerase/thioredoxin